MADHHFMIVKSSDERSTTTDVIAAGDDGSIAEIARLLGTDSVTDSTLKNARELKEKAAGVKRSL